MEQLHETKIPGIQNYEENSRLPKNSVFAATLSTQFPLNRNYQYVYPFTKGENMYKYFLFDIFTLLSVIISLPFCTVVPYQIYT